MLLFILLCSHGVKLAATAPDITLSFKKGEAVEKRVLPKRRSHSLLQLQVDYERWRLRADGLARNCLEWGGLGVRKVMLLCLRLTGMM